MTDAGVNFWNDLRLKIRLYNGNRISDHGIPFSCYSQAPEDTLSTCITKSLSEIIVFKQTRSDRYDMAYTKCLYMKNYYAKASPSLSNGAEAIPRSMVSTAGKPKPQDEPRSKPTVRASAIVDPGTKFQTNQTNGYIKERTKVNHHPLIKKVHN